MSSRVRAPSTGRTNTARSAATRSEVCTTSRSTGRARTGRSSSSAAARRPGSAPPLRVVEDANLYASTKYVQPRWSRVSSTAWHQSHAATGGYGRKIDDTSVSFDSPQFFQIKAVMDHDPQTALGSQLRVGKGGAGFEASKDVHGTLMSQVRDDTTVSRDCPQWMHLKAVQAFQARLDGEFPTAGAALARKPNPTNPAAGFQPDARIDKYLHGKQVIFEDRPVSPIGRPPSGRRSLFMRAIMRAPAQGPSARGT